MAFLLLKGMSRLRALRTRIVKTETVEELQHDNGNDPVRNLSSISKMLTESDLPAVVKERSVEVFTALGEAEAKTHGSTLDQVRVFSRN